MAFRPARRPFSTAILALFAATFAFLGFSAGIVMIVDPDGSGSSKFISIVWLLVMVTIVSYSAMIVLWRLFGKEVVDIRKTQLSVDILVGRFRLKSATYEIAKIKSIRCQTKEFMASGHRFSYDALTFDYDEKEIQLARGLPRERINELLSGPFNALLT